MIIVDPVTLGDATCTRPSPKWVYDGTGTLVEVPPDTLAVSYDPSDLSAAPFAVVDLEPETNYIRNNTMQGAGPGVMPNLWGPSDRTSLGISCDPVGVGVESGIEFLDLRYSGTATSGATLFLRFEQSGPVPAKADQKWVASVLLKAVIGDPSTIQMFVTERDVAAGSTGIRYYGLSSISSKLDAQSAEYDTVGQTTSSIYFGLAVYFNAGQAYDFTIRVALPHLCRDKLPRFPIKTANGAVTRAADVIGPTAGLIYSNVPMVEPPYDASTTYAKDVLVRDPITHDVYLSLIAANKGKPLTDEASWNLRGKTNRWAMLDEYNNTQTTNPEEIVIVLSPQSICEGLYLGNVDADEIELVVVDQSEGKVYSEVTSLVTASGSSSYYDWCFRPADRADYYFTIAMPPYASALVTVVLRKPGGVAKCGMAVIGLVDDFGPSLYGLSASGKDFSSTTFKFDGTSKTQLRDFAKLMNVDVLIDNGEIDYIQRKLFQLRQRPIVWIGGPYGATAVFGRYAGFDIVIPGLLKSDMSLQIEGSV
ncbi:hypothetical protein [Massilia timonae]|uniref:hypothetical protein n=1 Tax=Massilia timonae TaxID=47229 RepID=UPI0028D461B0|nr:hypothetical protein [Massilia timonae]